MFPTAFAASQRAQAHIVKRRGPKESDGRAPKPRRNSRWTGKSPSKALGSVPEDNQLGVESDNNNNNRYTLKDPPPGIPKGQDWQSIVVPQDYSDVMSQLTEDEFPPDSPRRVSDDPEASVASDSSLITFRRRELISERLERSENGSGSMSDSKTSEEVTHETTLHAHNKEDELMKDLVKRLQKDGTSGVLKFSKMDIEKLKNKERYLKFGLPQVDNVKFSTEEFGKLFVSDVLKYTAERPVVVELFVEEPPHGDVLELF